MGKHRLKLHRNTKSPLSGHYMPECDGTPECTPGNVKVYASFDRIFR